MNSIFDINQRQLESELEKFQPLLAAFDDFVAQQMGYLPGRPG